ncbi:MAG: hypothetical protein A2504_16690 [Bdellovibrionales bacterium RIFOXYD12_FULL_39_22]|nr:MAG: hypothetical protein A2385_14545 [Bdellovibrionales bacterium RIFOXYB1_FULL_39_21]OFZ45008.1 MAG: hypothetical protein A2485_13970 [Bdellovibrionales bacterium RIFOXYC12_FULL_39_17]OFZ49446.1 MAG: hypothetical protein A2404_08455 [Bdellovibrionales bacterium RIFOXYC1_FULL_39_130]OFZ77185.1 MAG: hypothetical protein A2560_07980 [Bdellovibrionales bacterium RIFOXYD1_FULL_39_84]OFZ95630.1 MAG: hypothetical protein A2504_16690 [Bdellovibrionales bacterium RIFOXYD12_FULL_39_22]HLE11144.1 Mu
MTSTANSPQLKFNKEMENIISDWLDDHCSTERYSPGLERISKFFEPLVTQIAKSKVKIITVGGTNGKGETAHTLEYLLTSRKQNVALWTSPHILSITERFRFNGINIDIDELFDLMRENGELLASAKFSYYEFLFYIFLKRTLLSQELDYIIFEVGIGGRFDAVNLLDADVAIITSISREHQEILGKTYRQILHEKLPIARPQKKLITSLELKYCQDLTATYCQIRQIDWIDLFAGGISVHSDNFSARNKKLAQYVYETSLGLGPPLVANYPAYKGRFEKISYGKCEMTFVGSHNIDGMRKLAHWLVEQIDTNSFIYDRIIMAFSRRDSDDIRVMVDTLCNIPHYHGKIVLTVFEHYKAFSAWEKLDWALEYFNSKKLLFIPDWRGQLKECRNECRTILITGSYYFVGEVQKNSIDSL